jgi:hypothetical protein
MKPDKQAGCFILRQINSLCMFAKTETLFAAPIVVAAATLCYGDAISNCLTTTGLQTLFSDVILSTNFESIDILSTNYESINIMSTDVLSTGIMSTDIFSHVVCILIFNLTSFRLQTFCLLTFFSTDIFSTVILSHLFVYCRFIKHHVVY